MEASTAAKISSGSRTRQGRAGQSRRYPGEVTLGSKADPGKTWDHFGFTVGSKQDFSHSIPSSSALGHGLKCSRRGYLFRCSSNSFRGGWLHAKGTMGQVRTYALQQLSPSPFHL